MAINVNTETLFPIVEINDYWRGKPLHLNTWRRLYAKGILIPGSDERVRLEVLHMAGTLYCSVEALDRFVAAQNAEPAEVLPREAVNKRQRAATAELAAML